MEATSVVTDAVQLASQTGRLDFLSAVLAVLAIILGIGAFPIFFFVQRRAERVATEAVAEALKGASERLESLAISKLESMLPTLYDDYMELVKNAVSAEEGNKIAEAASRETDSDIHVERDTKSAD